MSDAIDHPHARVSPPSASFLDRLKGALTGSYAIEREIGQGGMATVYLALDLKHNRRVALKVLKPELAAVVGAERFLAEIETTANLQHPHILPLYDSGQADSFLFYVMPYVEGETLRDRLDREKQLPVEEAVRIATAVANALDYAHEHGVVHRDIKPGNIMLQAGEPVVGDFGIALAVGAAGGTRLTETGLSVGTPYYMSPEQATGDMVIGPASDTYALGAVLYELLTGEPPYTGNTAQAVLGRIIQGTPVSATAIRRAVPANVDAAIRKALEKLPADRFKSAKDLARALADPSFRHGVDLAADASAAAAAGPWRMASIALGAATLGLAAVLALVLTRPQPPRPIERFAEPFLEGQEAAALGNAGFDLSPDGTMLVYRHNPGDGQVLFVRRWDELSATPVRETQGGGHPAVSPDGRELAFAQAGQVKVLALAGGPVRTLTTGSWPEWGPDGHVYATNDSGVVRIPAVGGGVEQLSRTAEGENTHVLWDVLPDGQRALIIVVRGDGGFEVRGLDLADGTMKHIAEGFYPRYLPSGHLTWGIAGQVGATMMAARFDPKRMELLGAPVAVLDALDSWSISDDGKLFYSLSTGAGGDDVQLLWVDRTGQATPIDPAWTFSQGGPDVGWDVSPDGTMLATRESTADGLDIWIKQLDAGPRSRLTFGESEERMPVWIPGTRDVAYLSSRGGNLDLWRQPADGTRPAELVLDFERPIATITFSPGAEWIVFRTTGPRGAEGARDIFAFRPGIDSVATPLLANPDYDEIYPAISPDGRWVAYQSTETDRHEIYVRPFPDVSAGRWQVSVTGGRYPKWSTDGRELFFQGPGREMMVAEIDTSVGFRAGTPRVLFRSGSGWISGDISGTYYAVAPDGRFVVGARPGSVQAEQAGPSGPRSILVNNFMEELNARVPR